MPHSTLKYKHVLCKQVERAVQKSGACTKYLTFKIKEINFGKRFCHLLQLKQDNYKNILIKR